MTSRGRTNWLPHVGFTIVYVLWGINMSSMTIGGREWDPFVFNGLRFASIVPFLWGYVWLMHRKGRISLRMEGKDLALIALLGALSAIGMEAMLSYALQFSNPANGAVLGRGFMPVVTVGIALLLRQMRLTWRILAGLPIALGGVLLIVAGGGQGFHLGADTLKGDMLLLLRSLLGALYLNGMNRLVAKYPLPLLISLEMTAGAISLLPFVLWKSDLAVFTEMSLKGWASLSYTAFVATLLGFTLHNWSLGKLGPFKSSVYGYLLPITAAVAGYFLLGAGISLNQAIGGTAVLAAMYLVQSDRMQMMKQSETRQKAAEKEG